MQLGYFRASHFYSQLNTFRVWYITVPCYCTGSHVVVLMFENTPGLEICPFSPPLQSWGMNWICKQTFLGIVSVTLEGLFFYNWSGIKKCLSNSYWDYMCLWITMSDRKLVVMIELCKEMNHEKWEKDSGTVNAKFKDLERYSNSTQNTGTKCFQSIQPNCFL